MDIVTFIIDLISRLWDCCSPHLTNLCNLRRNLVSLRYTIDQLKSKRNDVMKKIRLAGSDLVEPKEPTDEVKNWLRRVEAIELEIDEILQQPITTQILDSHGCFCRPRRSNNCWTDYKLSNLVVEKLSTLKELINEGDRFSVIAERCVQEQIQEMPTEAMVVGMEPKLEELWKFVNEDDTVRSLGIYGMGGVGKTTLLKQLNNEFSKRSHDFDLVIWVVVSKDLNLEKVQKQIANSLRLTLPAEPDLARDAKEIFRVLTKKKFVLFLDDIWQRIDLQSIGVPSCDNTTDHKTNKSMVIVFTTRSEVVCGQMEADRKIQINCLKWSEAWNLFQEKVGKEVINGHPQIPVLAEVVAKECHGLPLALNTIGRTMASKNTVHEWRHAINVLRKSASAFPGMDDEVLAILKFSYDSLLSDNIKSCFLYCSLFPEDHRIIIEELIEYWIAEGLIDDFENIDEARDQGYDIIGYLKSVCLLEGDNDDTKVVKMHDVVRDLAIWIVSDYGRRKGRHLIDNGVEPKLDQWEKAERILVLDTSGNYRLHISSYCSNLSTLIFFGRLKYSTELGEAFHNMPNLRLLRMIVENVYGLPASIDQLRELRYLEVGGVDRYSTFGLPSSLKFLVKLMFLRLGRCRITIPNGVIHCLSQLQVLDLFECEYIHWKVDVCLMELESLKHLNDLGITIHNLVDLQKLVGIYKFQLCTRRLFINQGKDITSLTLSISRSSSSSTSPSLCLANLKNLRTLKLKSCFELKELKISPWGMQTLECLILINLPKLEFVWDNKLKEEQLCLSNLQHVAIQLCESIKNLTWLAYAQDLQSLSLSRMGGIEEIVTDGFRVDGHSKLNIFSSLTHLQLFSLKNLRNICSDSLAFPVLECMDVIGCPKLKKLPLHNNSNKNNTLKGIRGEKEWWDSLEWDDDAVKTTFFPHFKYDRYGFF